MTRALTGGMLTAVQQRTVRPVFLFQGQFASGDLRLWTGYGDLVWDGNTYTGGGDMLSVSPIEESTDLTAKGFSVTITGIKIANLSAIYGQARHNLVGNLWLGLLDESLGLIADPFLLYSGRTDQPDVMDNAETVTITLRYEDELVDLLRPRVRRYTDTDQQNEYPGDRGMEYVTAIQDAEIVWQRG